MRIPKADPKKCTGCATCTALCPEIFELEKNSEAFVAKRDNYNEVSVQEAMDSCPGQAISWEEG